jgi:hypothetical protein
VVVLVLLAAATVSAQTAEPCITIHGRANYYGADGQLRIWHIGTHHEFKPDASSWDRVMGWLLDGVAPSERKSYASPHSSVFLFGDFEICPTEHFHQGAVQEAKVTKVVNRHYVKIY